MNLESNYDINEAQIKQDLETELMAEMKKRFINRVITPKLRREILRMVDEKIAEYDKLLTDVQNTKGPSGLGLKEN